MDWKEDTRAFDKIIKNITNLSQKEVQVGFFDTRYDQNNENLYVAQVAQWMDEGVPANHIPARPFFRNNFDAKVKGQSYKAPFIKMISNVASGVVSPHAACKNLGEGLKVELESIIDNGSAFAPNSPEWQAHKQKMFGGGEPLTYTGLMKESVQYKITKRT